MRVSERKPASGGIARAEILRNKYSVWAKLSEHRGHNFVGIDQTAGSSPGNALKGFLAEKQLLRTASSVLPPALLYPDLHYRNFLDSRSKP